MRTRTVVAALAVAAGALAAPAAGQARERLVLPAPTGTIPIVAYPGLPPERLRGSFVPGPVRDDERVQVLVGPDGAPASVAVTQRIELTGTGDYAVRERGPALRVTPLEDTVAPIIQRGAVVWQGFSPGNRLLSARIELDPGREALLLPLRVELSGAAVEPGGRVGPGRLLVRLVNQSPPQPRPLPTGDVAAADLVGPLTALLRYAEAPPLGGQPPAAGRGLPKELPARGVGVRTAVTSAVLRVTGSVKVTGTGGAVTVSGPGTTPIPDGAVLSGVLSGSTEVAVDVPAAGTLALDLTVTAVLDPRRLRPPDGSPSWAAWAARGPDEAQRRAAVDLLVDAAVAAARADEVAPYLGHPGPGPATTVFRYALAPAPPAPKVEEPVEPRPVNIALTGLAVVALAGGAAAAWRRL